MRGDIVYRVYALHEGRAEDVFFGAFRTIAEAEAKVGELASREVNGRSWAKQYHNRGFVIREEVVDTDFEIPSLPKPRDKYAVQGSPKPNRPGTWDSSLVEVFRRATAPDEVSKICDYERNDSLLETFEPFRQGSKEFALISRDYTKTAVLDLEAGRVIAEETDEDGASSPAGFCPVGFYVPDWWDVHDGSVIPGSEYWDADDEWPNGDFGFVWGCYWGDDTSWKVQYLDLSRIQEGVVRRDERFGYVELETIGFRNPCFLPSPETNETSAPPRFIRVSMHGGVVEVTFAVGMTFGLETGTPKEWKRLKIENFE